MVIGSYDDSRAGLSEEDVIFGTNTGALTAWAGSAALGTGESGGLARVSPQGHTIDQYMRSHRRGIVALGKCERRVARWVGGTHGRGMVVDTTLILKFTTSRITFNAEIDTS